MKIGRKAQADPGAPWTLVLAPAGGDGLRGEGGHSPKLCAGASCDRLACMAYKAGWRDGYSAGYAAGWTAGYQAGYSAGAGAGGASR